MPRLCPTMYTRSRFCGIVQLELNTSHSTSYPASSILLMTVAKSHPRFEESKFLTFSMRRTAGFSSHDRSLRSLITSKNMLDCSPLRPTRFPATLIFVHGDPNAQRSASGSSFPSLIDLMSLAVYFPSVSYIASYD